MPVLIPAARRGFTLVELLIALVVFSAVGAVTYRLLVSTQRVSGAQAERTQLQSNIRSGALVVPNELRQLSVGGAENDIVAMSPTSIEFRAMRGLGFTCGAPTATEVRVRASSFDGYRQPAAPRDGIAIFLENQANSAADDAWVVRGTTAVAAGVCDDGQVALTLTLTPALTAADLLKIVIGGPVRTFEVMEFALYAADGQSWLGARSVSGGGVMQPVLGPLAAADGFMLSYFDDAGAATTDRLAVRSIGVAFRGRTDRAVHSGAQEPVGYVQDSLFTRVALRNAPNP